MKQNTIIKSQILLQITAGVILTAHEVKKFKNPSFTTKNYIVHQYNKGNLKLKKKHNKQFNRKILIKATERKLIKKIRQTPNTQIKLTHIEIIKGLVKLKLIVIKKEIHKLKRRDMRQQKTPLLQEQLTQQ
ncbi:hypothetical protein JSR02_00490 [Candidatus Vidania fulgoroideae]|uniref:Uncharacterized protein n=1 Tax=Candidatus Vidania fulgoroideorum TaxID=881286 RepID=A0A975AEG1_9PROT|nr:hypothetical protein JSR02_00490 [Candidatus Vidania fulgoroideae]